MRMRLTPILALATGLALLAACTEQPVVDTARAQPVTSLPREQVIVNDPENPKGMQLRRPRQAGEPWPAYFRDVLLWPHTDESDNRLFTSMSQSGLTIQFIPETIFAVDGSQVLVLRGSREMVERMAQNVALDGVGVKARWWPYETLLLEDPRGAAWLGFVLFDLPDPPPERVMSSFALFGDAGGVADILDEEQVRQRYKVLRGLVDVIVEEILQKPAGN